MVRLSVLGLARHAPLFEAAEVDEETLTLLEDRDIQDLGVASPSERRSILLGAAKRRSGKHTVHVSTGIGATAMVGEARSPVSPLSSAMASLPTSQLRRSRSSPTANTSAAGGSRLSVGKCGQLGIASFFVPSNAVSRQSNQLGRQGGGVSIHKPIGGVEEESERHHVSKQIEQIQGQQPGGRDRCGGMAPDLHGASIGSTVRLRGQTPGPSSNQLEPYGSLISEINCERRSGGSTERSIPAEAVATLGDRNPPAAAPELRPIGVRPSSWSWGTVSAAAAAAVQSIRLPFLGGNRVVGPEETPPTTWTASALPAANVSRALPVASVIGGRPALLDAPIPGGQNPSTADDSGPPSPLMLIDVQTLMSAGVPEAAARLSAAFLAEASTASPPAGGASSLSRPVQRWHSVPGTSFLVDLFRPDSRDIKGARYWILTHFHSDHYFVSPRDGS